MKGSSLFTYSKHICMNMDNLRSNVEVGTMSYYRVEE
jgi:hypothetical protein